MFQTVYTIKIYLKVAIFYLSMNQEDPLIRAKKRITNACVEVAKSNRHSDASGLLRGILFLAKEPISLEELTERTGYSKSTVSSHMSFLENQGMVRRVITPGDKRYRYVPVIDPETIKAAMIKKLKKEIQLLLNALDGAERDLQECTDDPDMVLSRVSAARSSYKKTEELVDILSRYSSEELLEMLKKTKSSS
jgi:DNA-binding transcriptional regulator GbsR (MarR family)